jgi:translocation and assembly module TamA
VPPGLARESLPLKTGDPIIAANVEGAEANLLLRLPEQGYPFAELGLRDVLLDPDTDRGDYTLPVTPGPRASFGGFTTEGELAFDASMSACSPASSAASSTTGARSTIFARR